MAEHQLRLTGHPLYGWRLDCLHPNDAEAWIDPFGEWPGCTVQSWWGELGMEIVTDNDRHHPWPTPTAPTLPVDVVWLSEEDGPELVPASTEETTDGE